MAARKERAPKPTPPKVTCPACSTASSESYFSDNVARFGVCSSCCRYRNEVAEKLLVEMFVQDSGADPVACSVVALQWGMAFARAVHGKSTLPHGDDGAPLPALTEGPSTDPAEDLEGDWDPADDQEGGGA